MEVELFMGIFATMCIGTVILAFIVTRDDNYRALWGILVGFVIGSIVLFSIAAYMAPSWVSASLSEVVIPI